MIHLLKRCVTNEKTRPWLAKNKYVVDVDPRLTKPQIKQLFKRVFQVDVLKVNTHLKPLRKKRLSVQQGYLPRYKRAIVQIPADQTIPALK